MVRALRPRNHPDVVKSTLSTRDLRFNESTIDNILGAPNKIYIPERYMPDEVIFFFFNKKTVQGQKQVNRKREAQLALLKKKQEKKVKGSKRLSLCFYSIFMVLGDIIMHIKRLWGKASIYPRFQV